MKKLILILIIFWPIIFFAQDLFPIKCLTTEAGREGFPSWSPDGKQIVFQYTERYDSLGYNGLWVMSADGSNKDQIFKGIAEHPKWSPDGKHIVYDADTGRHMRMIPATGGDPIEFLPDTVKIFRGGLPCWSPDAQKIAYNDSNLSLCIYNFKTKQVTKLFSEKSMAPLPAAWTDNGKYILIALMEIETRKSSIWKISVNDEKHIQIKGHHENFYRHLALSPDGSVLVYAVVEDRKLGLYAMLAEGGKSIPFAVIPGGHTEGAYWSPDGKKIAFNRMKDWYADIWLMEVDPDELKKELNRE